MNRFPRYPRKSHTSGLARIRINNRDYYLGKFGSPESHDEYRRLMVEFASGTVPASKLDEVRTAMISASWMTATERADRTRRGKPIGWARSHTTHQIARGATKISSGCPKRALNSASSSGGRGMIFCGGPLPGALQASKVSPMMVTIMNMATRRLMA